MHSTTNLQRSSYPRSILAFNLLVMSTALGESALPPTASRRPVQLESRGNVRIDPYFWLREREDPEVIAYLKAENHYFEQQMAPLAPLRKELFEEFKARIKQDDSSVPYRWGDHYYYRRFEEGAQYPIHARKAGALDADEQILLDVSKLATGHGFYNVRFSSASLSLSGRYAAWSADTTGRNLYTIRILDMQTGQMLEDEIEKTTGIVAWAADDRTLFYAKQDPQTLRSFQILRHTLGTDAGQDTLVYQEDDETYSTYISNSKDRRFLLIVSVHTLATEWRMLPADEPLGDFKLFVPRERGHEHSIEHAGDHFYIRTNRQAENFRLMRTADDATAEANWEEVIPHRDDVFLHRFDVSRDFLVVSERKEGLTRLRVRPWHDPGAEHEIAFDDAAYAVNLGDNPNFDSQLLRFVYESPTTPKSTYDYSVKTRERTLLKRDEVLGGFDPHNYQAERLMVPARDGARVPVSLVYRKNLYTQDGSAPLMLYGYGSYGYSLQPAFDAPLVSLLDRGFVGAIAHIRGSQTLGRRWYEDGKLLNKKKTFTDFIDVAEHLADQRYADRQRLYAMGHSAGGLLMGAVANMRPDLFDGIIAHVPWVDVVTTMLDDSIPLTTNEYDEWGNPHDPEYYTYMLSYSPYDNVEAQAYPKLLVTTSLHDSQVQYWEPAKWVAKLRAMKTDDNLLLLHTNMDAGHGGASGRHDSYRETARDYAFFLHCAGLSGVAARGSE